MVQIGSALSGFALCALFWWLPVWRMSQASSPEVLFRYFVVVMMLVFGIFMVSSKSNSMSFLKTIPPLLCGAVASYGYSIGAMYVFGAGLAAAWLCFFLGGE
jgi:hypothetical protein